MFKSCLPRPSNYEKEKKLRGIPNFTNAHDPLLTCHFSQFTTRCVHHCASIFSLHLSHLKGNSGDSLAPIVMAFFVVSHICGLDLIFLFPHYVPIKKII